MKTKRWLPLAREGRGAHYSALRVRSEPFGAKMQTYSLVRTIQNEMKAVSCSALIGTKCGSLRLIRTRVVQRSDRDPVLFDR